MIEVINLWKRLGEGWVLRGVSLSIGGVVTLVGPNGSGKTTLVRIIAGVLEPTRGEVYIDGARPKVPARTLGVVFHSPTLYPELTVRENLRLFAKLSGGKLEGCPLGVCKVLDKPVKTLSFGWRRRVDLARALLPDPPNLVIDEPTTGLDEEARGELMDIVRQRPAALLTSPFPLGLGRELKMGEINVGDHKG
ncbi:MAG: ATP-binding cassette domain-containing protein [Pyrobaculum sp.]